MPRGLTGPIGTGRPPTDFERARSPLGVGYPPTTTNYPVSISATATCTASVVKGIAHIVPLATATGTASVTKKVAKSIAATATGTASLTKTRGYARTVSAVATGTASLTKNVGKPISATATGTASVLKNIAKRIPTVTATGTVTQFTFIGGVLDDFNSGALQNLTSRTGWAATVVEGATAATDAVPTYAVSSSGYQGGMWGSVLAADQEAWMIFGSVTGADAFVYARVTSSAPSALSGYYVRVSSDGSIGLAVSVLGSAGAIATAAAGTVSMVAGAAVGIRCVGTTIEGWYKTPTTSWTKILSTTDATINTSGSIGFKTFSGGRVDQFGGGPATGVGGTIIKNVGKNSLSAVATCTATLTKSMNYARSIAAVATCTASLNKGVGKGVRATATCTASVRKAITKSITATATGVASLDAQIAGAILRAYIVATLRASVTSVGAIQPFRTLIAKIRNSNV